MNAEQILALADPWMAPISPENVGGERADEDERHVTVVMEIGKLESPSAWNSPDWRVTIQQGGARRGDK